MNSHESNEVYVIGNGLSRFYPPELKSNPDYPELGQKAINRALRDAGISKRSIDHAFVCYSNGDSFYGQRIFNEIGGMTGIPIINLNNGCVSGSTGLYSAFNTLLSKNNKIPYCVIVLGFEKMKKGDIRFNFPERKNPLDLHFNSSHEITQKKISPFFFTIPIYDNAFKEFSKINKENSIELTKKHLAMISWKNHYHAQFNSYAQFRNSHSLETILSSAKLHENTTALQCTIPSDGAACAILCNNKFLMDNKFLKNQAVQILDISLVSSPFTTFTEKSSLKLAGFDMTKLAADQVYKKTGLSGKDIAIAEVQDTITATELISYEPLRLCPIGKTAMFIEKEKFVLNKGDITVNPSGGALGRGHPLGATGLAQCAEICWQLRNMCGKRQVKDAFLKCGLQHNIGIGGACVVAIYKRLNIFYLSRFFCLVFNFYFSVEFKFYKFFFFIYFWKIGDIQKF